MRSMTHLRTKKKTWCSVFVAGAILCLTAPEPALAVDVDAGDYTALPAGTNLGLVYYQHAERSSLYSKGSKIPINAGLDSDVGILRGVHFMDVGGYIVDPQFLLPFGKLKAKEDTAFLGDGSGVADLILAATVWLVNKPDTRTYFGITPFLFLPTGNYDNKKALNLGENRWKFTLQAGYITGLTDKISLDLVGDVTFFGQNSNFGAASQTMKQDPGFQGQAFLRYNFTPAFDVRGGVSLVTGGKTKIAGVDQADRANNSKFSVGASYFVGASTQALATYGRDISVREGFKESNRLNLRLLQIF